MSAAKKDSSSPARRWGALVGALLAVVLVGSLGWRSRKPATPSSAEEGASGPTRGPRPEETHHFQVSARENPAEQSGIVLEDIMLEKREVCEGEENLVTIKAHGPDGTDHDLSYFLPGQAQGPQIPMRVYKAGLEGGSSVWIATRDGKQLEVPLPKFKIKDCVAERRLGLNVSMVTNSPDEFDITGQLVEDGSQAQRGAAAFVPKWYEWEFGDGKKETTEVPTVRHSYLDRPQKGGESHFLIKLTARAENNETVVGRRAMTLNNGAFEALRQKKTMALMTRPVPRFGELFPDGTVRQQVKIWHISPEPLTVDTVDIEEVSVVDGADKVKARKVPARQVLGTNTIPPGEGITVPVVLDTKAQPDVNLVNYTITGKTPEGLSITGTYSILVPIKPPTRETGIAVEDEALKNRILAAREILQKEFVSDEDMLRLEHEGRLPHLDPANP